MNDQTHAPRRRGALKEPANADAPEYQKVREEARSAAAQIAAEEERADEQMRALRESRDRAMARLIGWGASYAAAATEAGLSKSAAVTAARRFPEEVAAGQKESQAAGGDTTMTP